MKKSAFPILDSNERVFFRYLSLFLLFFFAYCVALGWLNQLAPVEHWSRQVAAPLALLASVASAIALCRTGKNIVPPLAGMLVLALLLYVSKWSLDFSWDGVAYHQRAVIALLKGVNFLSTAEPTGDLWVDNYAKATWFYGATLVSWFGYSELGASYHFVLGGAASSYFYIFCRWAGRGRAFAFILALIVFFNPITLAQWFTYYNDATLGALGVLLFLSAVLMVREGRFSDYFIFLASAVLVVNVKASGIILVGAAFLYLGLAVLQQERRLVSTAKKVAIPFVMFLVLGFGVLGYSPYVQNLNQQRHVFYPLVGEGAVDILGVNSPPGFSENNRFYNFFTSIFSKSEDIVAADRSRVPVLKVPGKIYPGEISEFWRADTRIAGFGPWYSLALVLGLFSFCLLRVDWKLAGPLVFMVLVAVFVNPHAWWARYTPILWIFPLIPLVSMTGFRFKLASPLPVLLVLVMAGNVGMLVWNWLAIYPSLNAEVRAAAHTLQGNKLKVYPGPFALDLMLDRLGLEYEFVSQNYYERNKENFSTLAKVIQYERP